MLVGLPVARLRGLTLAVATLAVALAITSYLLNVRFFGWLPEGRIERPPLLGRVDLDSPTRFWYVALAALVAAISIVSGIRHSRTGRALLAVRDNERAAAAYGISPARLRLFAFGLSGGLAGFAGGVFVHHQQSFDLSPYLPLQNLVVLAMAVIGGVGSIAGAVLGALYLKGSEWLLPASWRLVATGAGVLVVLALFPSGLAGILDATTRGRRCVIASRTRGRSGGRRRVAVAARRRRRVRLDPGPVRRRRHRGRGRGRRRARAQRCRQDDAGAHGGRPRAPRPPAASCSTAGPSGLWRRTGSPSSVSGWCRVAPGSFPR